MRTSKKGEIKHLRSIYTVVSLLLIAILSFALFFNSISPPPTSSSENLGYRAFVCVYKNGELHECSSNVLYNKGANMTRDFLGTATGTSPVTVIALCNATASGSGSPLGCDIPAAAGSETFIAYNTCGLANATGTYSVVGGEIVGGNWSVQNTFTVAAGCQGLLINVTRLQNASDIFAGNTFNLLNVSETDTVTVNWTITVS